MGAVSSITYNGSGTTPNPPNGQISSLDLNPNLSLSQMVIKYTTTNSNTIDFPLVQFAIYKTTLVNYPNYIPPGTWDMNLYAKADTQNDEFAIGLRFFLLGRNSSTGVYTSLVPNGSDLTYLYDSHISQKITMTMYIQSVIDITNYDLLYIVVTSRNQNATESFCRNIFPKFRYIFAYPYIFLCLWTHRCNRMYWTYWKYRKHRTYGNDWFYLDLQELLVQLGLQDILVQQDVLDLLDILVRRYKPMRHVYNNINS
jgi:hypothetical protein